MNYKSRTKIPLKKRRTTKSAKPYFGPSIQKTTDQNSIEEEVQTKAEATTNKSNPAFFGSYLSSTAGKGKALQPNTKQFFESKLGADFGNVKLHTDEGAALASKTINAKAFTFKNNIFFNKGAFNENSIEGRHLLAHELTHVMQQQGNSPMLQRTEDPKEITAPLPKDAVIDKDSGDASFTISGLNFVAEPDGVIEEDKVTWREQEVEPEKSGATTAFALNYKFGFKKASDTYTKAWVTYTLYIKTFYKKGVDKTAASGYGRGTTEADKKAGNTTLKFHESQHGKDIQDYIGGNPLPTFKLKFPATQAKFDAAKTVLTEKIEAYSLALQTHSEQHTDEVGTPKTPPTPPPAVKAD